MPGTTAAAPRRDGLTKAEHGLFDQSNLLPRRQLIFVFAIMSVSMLIQFIDQNGISTTLPTIAADLDAQDTISWAGTSSLLANTTFQMLYGRLSDIFGRKTVYLSAIAMLVVADLCCGLSTNAAMFYVFRAIAGIGGGGVTNIVMIIVSDIVTLEQRGKYQGLLGSMVGLGNVAGPFLAAAFVERSTWRAFFWMLAPLGALGGLLSYFYLPSNAPTTKFSESAKQIDWLGSLTSSIAVIFLLIPISGGGSYFQWSSPMVISMLVIGTLSLILFIIIEWKVAKLPMMPMGIYRDPAVSALLAQTFLYGIVFQSYIYYVPLYLQNAHQFSVLTSALMTITMVGAQSIFSVSSGLYISRFKRYGEIIWVGFAVWLLGTGLALLYDRHTSPGVVVTPLIITGIGVGCTFQPTLVAMQAHSPKARRAVIISNRNFFRCAGGACGLAVSAAVLQAKLRASLPPEYAHLASSTYALPKGHVPAAVLDAYMAASHAVFLMQVPIIGACMLITIFVKDKGLSPIEDQPQDIVAGDEEMGAVDRDVEAAPAEKTTSRSARDNVATRSPDTEELGRPVSSEKQQPRESLV